jgi:hypothetical protein
MLLREGDAITAVVIVKEKWRMEWARRPCQGGSWASSCKKESCAPYLRAVSRLLRGARHVTSDESRFEPPCRDSWVVLCLV